MAEQGGMLSYWHDLIQANYINQLSFIGGCDNNLYFLSIMNGATLVDAFLIDTTTMGWERLGNVKASMFVPVKGNINELYMASRASCHLVTLSDIFTPTAANASDADGTAILPEVETCFYQGAPGIKNIKELKWGYDLKKLPTPAGEHPTIPTPPTFEVSYVTDPESDSYTVNDEGLSDTDGYDRRTTFIGIQGEGIGLKLRQTQASTSTIIHTLEAEIQPQETGKQYG